MSKWLVLETTHFYDGHGEEADGDMAYFITEDPIYSQLDSELRYNNDLYEQTELYEQDGYHTTANSYMANKITDQEAILINLTIDAYSKLGHYLLRK